MNPMTDDVLADLITAIVAARADGDGVLTIAAVRGRLEDAKLQVQRVEDASPPSAHPPFDDDEISG